MFDEVSNSRALNNVSTFPATIRQQEFSMSVVYVNYDPGDGNPLTQYQCIDVFSGSSPGAQVDADYRHEGTTARRKRHFVVGDRAKTARMETTKPCTKAVPIIQRKVGLPECKVSPDGDGCSLENRLPGRPGRRNLTVEESNDGAGSQRLQRRQCCTERGSKEQAMHESPRFSRNQKALSLPGFPVVSFAKMRQTKW
ncbi:uncharacterized protein [Dermacentor albipictus]|uniref:uncharacterized protein isoform X4 n=1 Tax=Dermacentor albipictus TaxID=60249 RepID=UPI0038FD08D1